jgi:Protein of unknown function (DUF742)
VRGDARDARDAETRFDDAAGPMVRPYTVTGGRTLPASEFRLVTMVMSTGRPLGDLSPEHDQILDVCERPVSVAEVSARVRLPVAVIKILLADLLAWRGIVARAPAAVSERAERAQPDRRLLEAVLHGLRGI